MTDTIVFLDPLKPAQMERLAPFAAPRFAIRTAASRERSDQVEAIRAATYAITGDVPVDAALMGEGAAAGLRAVHKWGVGYDNIDLEAARRLGVRVMRTTGSNAVPVAETAVAMMLALSRRVVAGHLGVLGGGWPKGEIGPTTMMLSGKTVGLVGMGYIGTVVARLLSGFGCPILYAKPHALPEAEAAALNATHVPLERLLAEADIVSLHCALNDATRGLIGAAELASMKRGALLVNTARGGIVDEDALADAIECGHLAGAALDVFAEEPVPAGHRLVGLPGVITTPHTAAQAADNFAATVSRMIANITHVAEGRQPPEVDVLV